MAKRSFRKLKRAPPSREELVTITIVCEGRNTEPDYFHAMRLLTRLHASVRIAVVRGAGDPSAIARTCGERVGKSDQVWAVFDRDEHPHFDSAIDECRRIGAHVAYSNPCFELWLVLHIEDYNRMGDRDEVQRHLGTLQPTYDRSGRKTLDFAALINGVDDAERRADAQISERKKEGDPRGCPSTTAFRLTRILRGIPN